MRWTTKVTAAVIVVLTLGAGVAFAATQMTSSGGTNVCVNDTNGLMRVGSTCREGEHALTIGGGSDVRATQQGTFTVSWGETSAAKVLPLTGVSISGRCQLSSPDIGLARVLIEAASGQTMDVFANGPDNPVSQTSVLTAPLSSGGTLPVPPGFPPNPPIPGRPGTATAIVTSGGATATLTLGGHVDVTARTCTYLWQAVETPN
jgi:hypothetical protein